MKPTRNLTLPTEYQNGTYTMPAQYHHYSGTILPRYPHDTNTTATRYQHDNNIILAKHSAQYLYDTHTVPFRQNASTLPVRSQHDNITA